MPEILKNGATVEHSTRIGDGRVILAITKDGNQYATWYENYSGTTLLGSYFEWPHMYDTQEDAYNAAFRDYLTRVRTENERFARKQR